MMSVLLETKMIAGLREAKDNGVSAEALLGLFMQLDLDLIERALRGLAPRSEACRSSGADVVASLEAYAGRGGLGRNPELEVEAGRRMRALLDRVGGLEADGMLFLHQVAIDKNPRAMWPEDSLLGRAIDRHVERTRLDGGPGAADDVSADHAG